MSREYLSHNLPGMASSLSYTTLLALVPLFAIILGVLGFVRDGLYTEMFIDTLKHQIPAVTGMNNLIDAIREIAGNARAIVGVGVVMFFGTGFFMFITVARDFNRIWKVEKSRSIMIRFSGFITAVILVPLLVILSIYVNLYVARTVDTLETVVAGRSAVKSVETNDSGFPGPVSGTVEPDGNGSEGEIAAPEDEGDRALADPLILSRDRLVYDSENPDVVSKEVERYRSGGTAVKMALRLTSLLLSILGMSAIYYFFPNLKVKWWAALSGGVMAGLALELGNYLFRIYAGMTSTVLLKIYGTLLAIPLAIGWLWILWVIVLLGAVVGYVVQHFNELSEQMDGESRNVESDLFIALLLTAETAERYDQGRSTSDLVDDLAGRTGFSPVTVKAVLAKLLENGVLNSVEGSEGDYVPGRSMASLTMDQVVFPVMGDVFTVPSILEDEKYGKVVKILEAAGFALKTSLENTTLAELASVEPEEEVSEAD